jgi:hypothetical protein
MVAYERPHRDIGFHFVDQVAREAKMGLALGDGSDNTSRFPTYARTNPPAARPTVPPRFVLARFRGLADTGIVFKESSGFAE